MTKREIKKALRKVRALVNKLDAASTELSDSVAQVWGALEDIESEVEAI